MSEKKKPKRLLSDCSPHSIHYGRVKIRKTKSALSLSLTLSSFCSGHSHKALLIALSRGEPTPKTTLLLSRLYWGHLIVFRLQSWYTAAIHSPTVHHDPQVLEDGRTFFNAFSQPLTLQICATEDPPLPTPPRRHLLAQAEIQIWACRIFFSQHCPSFLGR